MEHCAINVPIKGLPDGVRGRLTEPRDLTICEGLCLRNAIYTSGNRVVGTLVGTTKDMCQAVQQIRDGEQPFTADFEALVGNNECRIRFSLMWVDKASLLKPSKWGWKIADGWA